MQVSADATGITKLRQSPQIDKVETRSQAPQKLPVEQPQQQSLQHSVNKQISSLFSQQSNSSLLASNNLSSSLFRLPKSAAKYEIAQTSSGDTNFAANTWVPTNGTVKVYPSAYAGERYVENKFYWAGATRLAAFAQAANSTYEHDFALNNSSASTYGSGTYLTLEQTGQQTPWITFWDTNLPRPYLDTQFVDRSYVVAYTIGSADARNIQPWIMYTNYIRTPNGPASKDNGSLVGQLGTRSPFTCFSTWCSFGTQPAVPIYAPWTLDPVPGTFNWTR